MRVTIPARTLAMRWNAIACAVAIFAWSTPEDDRLALPAALGAWLALTLIGGWTTRRWAGATLDGWRLAAACAGFGTMVGALAPVCALLVMLFKDARHAHMYPDFPPVVLGGMLALAPVWALAGGLTGLGAALARAALSRRAANRDSSAGRPVL